jgi:hypothetical protein
VAHATFEPGVGRAPTYLNLGNAYPDPDRFDVVIHEEVGDRFDRGPGPSDRHGSSRRVDRRYRPPTMPTMPT